MKKLMTVFLVLIAGMWIFSTQANAGKPFEGVITYKITYPDSKASESQMAMYPKVLIVSVKGDKSRTDISMAGMNTVEITDYKEKMSVTLLNMMGQKYAIKKTLSDMEKEAAEVGKPSVELQAETKVIAGYTCKKAIVTVNNDGAKSTFEVFYCPELGSKLINFSDPIYKDIDGTLMEFSMIQNGMTMKITASSIEKKSLPEKDFQIPADYTITTVDEMKSKFGGGNE
ncbi:MAG TPA: hypothetical protein PLK82_05225 [Bacteroidales bacterium]|nr:hypothetical protein [Bacteroidales bacterium]